MACTWSDIAFALLQLQKRHSIKFVVFCWFLVKLWLDHNRCLSPAQRKCIWQVKWMYYITARLLSDSLALLTTPLLLCPLPAGTSPHAPTNVHVAASSTWANVSWEASYDGGFQQTFTVWYGLVWVIPACFASCFFFFQYLLCCYWKCLFQGCVQNSCENKEMENTWRSSVCEFASPIMDFLLEKNI